MFRRGVSGLTCEAFDASARSGVYNRAASLLEHQRNLVFHAQEHTAKIDTDDPVPLLLGDITRGPKSASRLQAAASPSRRSAPGLLLDVFGVASTLHGN